MVLDNTLMCLKEAVQNNFVPAFMLIASAGMSMHYEYIQERYAMCSTSVGIGRKNTGKSMAHCQMSRLCTAVPIQGGGLC